MQLRERASARNDVESYLRKHLTDLTGMALLGHNGFAQRNEISHLLFRVSVCWITVGVGTKLSRVAAAPCIIGCIIQQKYDQASSYGTLCSS